MVKKDGVSEREVSQVMTALAKRRWAKTTKEQRSETLRQVVKARWAKRASQKPKGGK